MKPPRLLIVEDNRPLALAISALAERHDWRSVMVPTLARADEELGRGDLDLILLDLGLPDGNGLDFLRKNRGMGGVPVAVMTAHGDVENAIAARKLGVTAFFDKPVDFEKLVSFLEASSSREPSPRKADEKEAVSGKAAATALIGAAPGMRKVFQLIAQACATSEPVVVRGEIGTGKTHVACLIQEHAVRGGCHCLQALPDTDAVACDQAVAEAAGASLLIENLPALSPDAQKALINRLDHPGTEPVRLMATVDEEGLHAKVRAGKLLPELYYRLQVLEIDLPPLRDRLDDLPALASYFLGEQSGSRFRRLSSGLMEMFQKHSWPGNLHELRNLIRYLVVAHSELAELTSAHLPPSFGAQAAAPGNGQKEPFDHHLDEWLDRQLEERDGTLSYRELHADLERRLLKLLLNRHANKPSHLARAMKINRVTLRKKLQDPGEDSND